MSVWGAEWSVPRGYFPRGNRPRSPGPWQKGEPHVLVQTTARSSRSLPLFTHSLWAAAKTAWDGASPWGPGALRPLGGYLTPLASACASVTGESL